MGDMGDYFRDVREESKERKERNRMGATEALVTNGVPFTDHNNGIHLVVDSRIDYWPSTGLFICRHTKFKQRGVQNLLNFYNTTKGSK